MSGRISRVAAFGAAVFGASMRASAAAPRSAFISQPYFTGTSAPSSAFSTKRVGSLGLGLRSNRPFDGLRAMSTLAGGGDGSMKVLYDGKCPICLFEIKWLEGKSKKLNLVDSISFVDVADDNYDASANGNVSYDDAMKVMTVVRPDGSVSTGMAAFEDMYGAVKMGWVFAFLKYPAARRLFDRLYDFWAAYRLPVTGRGSLDDHLRERAVECGSDACKARKEM